MPLMDLKNIGAKLAPFISIITRVITNSRRLVRSFQSKMLFKGENWLIVEKN